MNETPVPPAQPASELPVLFDGLRAEIAALVATAALDDLAGRADVSMGDLIMRVLQLLPQADFLPVGLLIDHLEGELTARTVPTSTTV